MQNPRSNPVLKGTSAVQFFIYFLPLQFYCGFLFSEAFGTEKLRLVAEKKNCSVDSGSLPMANRTTHKTLHSKEEIL